MYSVVLAAMLTAGASTPDWHHCHGCYSYCHGCYSCGCYAYPVYRTFGHHCCHSYVSYCGCYCSGYYCGGCYCSGYYCGGCYCSGYVYSGCYCSGCYCSGCYSCSICCGSVVYSAPTVITVPPVVQPVPVPVPVVPPAKSTLTPQEIETLRALLQKATQADVTKTAPVLTNTQQNPSKTASITVLLPADARLFVDNVECPLTSAVRTFNTPPLNANQKYFYSMKVEVARDGKTVSETQRVVITPGQDARVDFNDMASLRTVAR